MLVEQREQLFGLLVACVLDFHEPSFRNNAFRCVRSELVNAGPNGSWRWDNEPCEFSETRGRPPFLHLLNFPSKICILLPRIDLGIRHVRLFSQNSINPFKRLFSREGGGTPRYLYYREVCHDGVLITCLSCRADH